MSEKVPLESEEQAAFVQWLELQDIKFTAIARKGFPDMVVIIPKNRSRDGLGYCLMIENKRVSGGVQSPEQKEWQSAINGLGVLNVQYYLCKGAAKAIETVSHYLAKVDNSAF